MASLKELRNRIASVQATQKITRAMQMVAASKLRRAQEAAEAARPGAALHQAEEGAGKGSKGYALGKLGLGVGAIGFKHRGEGRRRSLGSQQSPMQRSEEAGIVVSGPADHDAVALR